ncbi:Holliday junction resolvase RuvX [Mesomycoplasma lagogenitalium]|uniref:Putative pre-16S rRNA nuclease n=1 Tax=Mesomycoplasma lagogenitalium TaxID=171286 RepID=A0ABY8LT59_9BACT|nr:Holliday junction resolvase RuvX [Mesomycoplasma lagogenitalium]WGI36434.1 Holliday junction resolvase RuvX [Mesomycoplasma lagogenitalium]
MKRKLALDLGTKTCGFSISDSLNIIAIGLENFHFPENDFSKVLVKIKEILKEYEVDTFVLGYPLKMSGNKSDRTVMVEDFKLLLEANFQIPVIYIDERETTKRAKQIMIDAGLSRKKQKKNKDKLAAQLILEDYLMRL